MFLSDRPQLVSRSVILSRKDDSGEMSTTPELQFGEKQNLAKNVVIVFGTSGLYCKFELQRLCFT